MKYEKMKITAGMGTIDEYPAYARAGADEVFCGYVPDYWTEKYGILSPMNRREVLYYNVQIGSRSELKILRQMREVYQVPVSITLNALYYLLEQYPLLKRMAEECLEEGFDTFIVADPALILYFLQVEKLPLKIHVSGELGQMNREMIRWCIELGVKRIIFHRQVTISEMKQMIEIKKDTNACEYEAFLLNERCHFQGAYCNSLHCDELPHMCLVPYRLGEIEAMGAGKFIETIETSEIIEDLDITGSSGCGLCFLWKLREAGVTWLKIVGRGNFGPAMEADIRAVKRALAILEESQDEEEYILSMKKELFPDGCSGECYY